MALEPSSHPNYTNCMAESWSQPERSSTPHAQSRSIFVGRQREMNELKAALEDALLGRGRLTMLVGEPGIGKTRTAEELTSYAETRGAQVHWGWCYEGEGAPPYWPWVQVIRSYVQQVDSQRLQAELGPGAADIAEISTEVRHKLSGLSAPPALAPEQARFRLFDSLTSFLNNASKINRVSSSCVSSSCRSSSMICRRKSLARLQLPLAQW